MKKSFEYDQTKYDPNAPTRTEEFLTADGVKTLTTDANDGAVLIQDSVDGDSLNPVTAAAVATAIEQGGGGGGGVPDVADPLYVNPDDAVALRFGSGMRLEEGDFGQDDTLAVAVSGTGGLAYDDMEENALAVQLDPDGAIENFIDDGQQVGLRVKVDGTSIDINASGQLEAIGGGTPSGIVQSFDWSTVTYYDIQSSISNGNTPVILYDRFSDNNVVRGYLNKVDTDIGTYIFTTPVQQATIDTSLQSYSVTTFKLTSAGGKFVSYGDQVSATITTDSTLSLTQPNPYAPTLQLSVATPIPAFDPSTDIGKVLQVTANGLAWVNP